MTTRRRWTEEERELIREHYTKWGAKRLALRIARSANSIANEAHRLGIFKWKKPK